MDKLAQQPHPLNRTIHQVFPACSTSPPIFSLLHDTSHPRPGRSVRARSEDRLLSLPVFAQTWGKLLDAPIGSRSVPRLAGLLGHFCNKVARLPACLHSWEGEEGINQSIIIDHRGGRCCKCCRCDPWHVILLLSFYLKRN